MKKDILKFLINSSIVIVSLVIVDLCVGFVGSKTLDAFPDFDQVTNLPVKNNYRMMRMEADVVIIGASRASHHYNTTMLSDSIKQFTENDYSVYNAGIDGQFVNQSCLAIECILDRYTPKLVVFDLRETEFRHEKGKPMKLNYINFSAPYYHKTKTIKRYFDEMSFKECMCVQSNLFCYGSGKILRYAYSVISGGTKSNDGYSPIFGSSIDTTIVDQDESPKEKVMDDYTDNNMRRVLKLCKNKGLNLVLASSPGFCPKDDNALIHSLCKEYGLPYIEIYNTNFFNSHPELFKDASHLNDDGATIFTQLFFEELKPYLEVLK